MAELMAVVYSNPHWAFIALGGILLIFELMGTGGYSLWSGIAAFIVGLIAWVIPLSWPLLWLLFAILTLAIVYLWWCWLKKHGGDRVSDKSQVNQPKKELVGTRTVVVNAIKNGTGRVKINDGTWLAECHEDLPVGTKVVVVDVNGIILSVTKSEQD